MLPALASPIRHGGPEPKRRAAVATLVTLVKRRSAAGWQQVKGTRVR